jgi:hypothetical protein
MLKGIAIIFIFGFSLVVASLGFCNPVAIWLFDEGKGDTVKDSSGNGNNGKITGTSLWVDGKFQKALYFDGGAKGVDYVTVPDSNSLDPEDAITMMAWVKLDQISGWKLLFKKEAVYEPTLSEGKVVVYIANPSEAWKDPAQGATSIKQGEWYHIAGTFDGAVIRAFVNGKVDGEATYKGTIGVTDRVIMMGTNVVNNQPMRNCQPLFGAMDDVAIFDNALSESEITSLMTKGLASIMAVEPSGKLSVTWGAIKRR